MTAVILDANAAIEIILKRGKSELFKNIIGLSDKVITSEFFKIEVANVLRKYCKGGYIPKEVCFKSLYLARDLIDEFVSITHDYSEALSEALRLNYSVYDMLYLILARDYRATLLTCDGPLNRIAEEEGITTIHSYKE
jgi:predicted nucleic acid-binding protein